MVRDIGHLTKALSPLEGATAHFFDLQRPAHEVLNGIKSTSQVADAAKQYQTSLESAGLLANAEQRSANWNQALVTTAILLVIATIKIILALERGHRNIWFLVAGCLIACMVAMAISGRRLTHPGREALADLQTLFSGLKQSTAEGARVSPADAAFVAAIFGLGAFGGSREIYAKTLFPSASSSSGCGSSCGSSSGGGDGGGGSGCGGGGSCGGCGGG